MITVSIKNASKIVNGYISKRLPVLLVGSPGLGKSSIIEDAANIMGYDLIISHPVVCDPTDAKGLPFPSTDGNSAKFLPYGDLFKAINARNKTIWFLDDLGQASQGVQASFMQLLLARSIGEQRISETVTFVAATNKRTDRAGVNGILDPVLSRFATILEVETSTNDFIDWAINSGRICPEIIAFLRFRPELLYVPKKERDMENFPSPRTWEFASLALGMGFDSSLEFIALQGAIGQGAASELTTFLKMYRASLPCIQDIIDNPKGSSVNYSTDILWAITAALTKKTNLKNIKSVFQYAENLFNNGKGEFALLLVKDILNKNENKNDQESFVVEETSAFTQLMLGPIGKIHLA